jgi:hypothetical protein
MNNGSLIIIMNNSVGGGGYEVLLLYHKVWILYVVSAPKIMELILFVDDNFDSKLKTINSRIQKAKQ